MTSRLRVLLLIVVACTCALPLLDAQQVAAARVDPIVTRLMRAAGVPGVAVGLASRDGTLFLKGYGVRNAGGDPVTEDTLFGVGSLTKALTALDVAQLVDAGRVSLDSPVVSYVPGLRLSDPGATRELTVRQVLSQASGLPRSDAVWVFGSPADRRALVDDIAHIRLTAPPGALWQYSNQNYLLAGFLVEQVTGETWEQYTREHVLDPLAMKDADFDVATMQQAADWSQMFRRGARGMSASPFPTRIFANLALMGPAGSINASVRDMTRFAVFQLGDGTAAGRRIVSTALLDEMHRTQIFIGRRADRVQEPGGTVAAEPRAAMASRGYALGWFTEDYRGHRLLSHPGVIGGFRSSMTLDLRDGVGVVVLTNSRNGSLLVNPLRFQLIDLLRGFMAREHPLGTVQPRGTR